ncbi:Fe-S protein assembly co-chaperone HscB [Thorsellia kenyensis]|uniref:Co-chaperone protein HscB n=1 Tax=Thorsellia kenyensis TaxID=1549888 RepID=A0ABV6CGB5_9GAMM
MDYFKLFDLSEDFFIDISDLTEIYQEKQRLYHPDRFASADDKEKLSALQMATEINAAYQTLKDPLTRAGYLLQCKGIDVQNEALTLKDNKFLTHQFELREKIDSLQTNRNLSHEDLLVELTILVQQIDVEQRNLKNELFTAVDYSNWENAADSLRKLKYYERLLGLIDDFEEKLAS